MLTISSISYMQIVWKVINSVNFLQIVSEEEMRKSLFRETNIFEKMMDFV